MQYKDITWSKFEEKNPDTTSAFEQLCSMLFKHAVLKEPDLIFHANSNNPGIEIEPVSASDKKRVSFQAKYFSSMDYPQIKHSAEKTVEYYSGRLDVVYIFCNKDVNTESKSYKDIASLLANANIEIRLITNIQIINLVVEYPHIANAFFDVPEITEEWCKRQITNSLNALGVKYNKLFNVDTEVNTKMHIFMRTEQAANYFNSKKKELLEENKRHRYGDHGYREYLEILSETVLAISDVTRETLDECVIWGEILSDKVVEFRDSLNRQIKDRKQKNYNDFEKPEEFYSWERRTNELEELYSLPNILELSNDETKLLNGSFLFIKGDAGVGKSQALAYHAASNLDNHQTGIFLLGSEFLNTNAVVDQIPQILGITANFESCISAFERIAEKTNQFFFIFIDAINESSSKEIWKQGLSRILNIVKNSYRVRMVVSLRSGYEKAVLADNFEKTINDDKMAVSAIHRGFETDSIKAIKEFLNYYEIPFAPSFYFDKELRNPLFLTLFCSVYEGGEFDLFALFEQFIQKVDEEAKKAIGLNVDDVILKEFLKYLLEYFISTGERTIKKKELLKLEFWNDFGITAKLSYINALLKGGALTTFTMRDNEDYYDISYDLMRDFLSAKLIFEKYDSKEGFLDYLKNNLLNIQESRICNYGNENLFIILCGMYYGKYKEECIDVIDSINEWERNNLYKQYLDSFSWRKRSEVSVDEFREFANSHPLDVAEVYRVLIENSAKENHPLNVKFLSEHLMKFSLAERDYYWTIFINDLYYSEERIHQLIEHFSSEEHVTNSNYELLLELMAWFLTASNRMLRDNVSQAMINIMREDISYCAIIWNVFKDVNDPYMYERIMAVCFGAVLKRTHLQKDEIAKLAKNIYDTVFENPTKYQDILFLDYARLILERYMWEYPDECGWIEREKIEPPYGFSDVPVVEKQDYNTEKDWNGMSEISNSMHPDCISVGAYGDFGRYRYESAAHDFVNVDIENLYHSSMQYIRNHLCYKNEMFSEYDMHCNHGYYRHETQKIERIGKKYQWITMHHMLALIADNHLVRGDSDTPDYTYKGAWETSVRDFDPTLNEKHNVSSVFPVFERIENNIDDDDMSDEEMKRWSEEKPDFFDTSDLCVSDSSGNLWVYLYHHAEIKNRKYIVSIGRAKEKRGAKRIWKLDLGCFVAQSDFDKLSKTICNMNFMGRWFPEYASTYRLYNREVPWSPACENLKEAQWKDYSKRVEGAKVKHTGKIPVNFEENEDGELVLQYEQREWETTEDVEEKIAAVMPATVNLLFEWEYDGSQSESSSVFIPCIDLIEKLQLRQLDNEDAYYSPSGDLVAFDGTKDAVCDGLVIRADYLNDYLKRENLFLFWTGMAEKNCFTGEKSMSQKWSEWSSFSYYQGGKVRGTYEMKESK